MAPTSTQTGIIDILTRLHGEIFPLEAEAGLLFGKGDLRPRIEYFHDAVRALVKEANGGGETGRLRIEMLAYDAEALRYIQGMPLAAIQPGGRRTSPQTLPSVQLGGTGSEKRGNRQLRERLGGLYQQYATLFVALFKPFADRDYRDRVEEANEAVTQMNGLINALNGKLPEAMLGDLLAQLDDPQLRAAVQALVARKKKTEASTLLRQKDAQEEKTVTALESAHARYAMAQLAIFEQGKEIVKQLAASGMNLAGRFVENAMVQATRERGR